MKSQLSPKPLLLRLLRPQLLQKLLRMKSRLPLLLKHLSKKSQRLWRRLPKFLLILLKRLWNPLPKLLLNSARIREGGL